MEKHTLITTLENIIQQRVSQDVNLKNYSNLIYDSLHKLLNGDFNKFAFKNKNTNNSSTEQLDYDSFQNILSKINENQIDRKKRGVFYTPKDVTEYINLNAFINLIDKSITNIYSSKSAFKFLSSIKHDDFNKLLFEYSVFDPASGAGEFLVNALELKVRLLESQKIAYSDNNLLSILKTIYGNDINETSIEITKIRLFFTACIYLRDHQNLIKVVNILNTNFFTQDFIKKDVIFRSKKHSNLNLKFNIIVGNPPYVEDRVIERNDRKYYGNIYANFLENSAHLLGSQGVMGFVLPLSFISTPRMGKIRELIFEKCSKQLITSYADRPSCLFAGAHQKLNILICSNLTKEKQIYTSGYHYWNKKERNKLLADLKLTENPYYSPKYIPKLANTIEKNIFNKIITDNRNDSILGISNKINRNSVFLNMRATFWIKAFTFNPGSNEYKEFLFPDNSHYLILSILNSSLFFFFWVVVSDCWHITNKELDSFKVILSHDKIPELKKLYLKFEEKLEKTKEYIGSKQTDYIYKHKNCKNEIDNIDDILAEIYNLTKVECIYIKNYHLKYRMSIE